jgi:catechol 2,3-dioxygenase-like lactoylglutathione lyase family enzyme
MTDRSFIHLALVVADLDASVDFYTRYAAMKVVYHRHDKGGGQTAWLNDGKRPFVLVLVAHVRRSVVRMILRRIARAISRYVARPAHLGIACSSREEVESLCRQAEREGRLLTPANDAGPVVGFYGMLSDPDGYNLELSYGQEVGMTVENADSTS